MDRKRSESRRGRGPEREGRRAVSGGKRAQLMMKEGHVGVRARYAFSSLGQYDVRVHEAGWGGSWARSGGVQRALLRRVLAIAKHSEMIKGFSDNFNI